MRKVSVWDDFHFSFSSGRGSDLLGIVGATRTRSVLDRAHKFVEQFFVEICVSGRRIQASRQISFSVMSELVVGFFVA